MKQYKVQSAEVHTSPKVTDNGGKFATIKVGDFWTERPFTFNTFNTIIVAEIEANGIKNLPPIEGLVSVINVPAHFRTNPRTGVKTLDEKGNPVIYNTITVFTREGEDPQQSALRQLRMYELATEGAPAEDAANPLN